MQSLFAQGQMPSLTPVGPLGWVGVLAQVVALVCWILVVIKMFQNGNTVLGIISIVLCGIGGLIAFIYGWMKSGEWQIQPIMLAWTAAIVVAIAINGYILSTAQVVVP